MVGYAVRITRSFDDLRAVCERWKDRCETMVVYEHDEGANRQHCHLYLGGVDVTTKRLKQISGLPNLGNTLWSFKQATEDIDVYITYMSKGKYDPSYLYGYELKDCDRLRLLWVTPPLPKPPALEKYLAFEVWLFQRPVEMRVFKDDVELLCRRYILDRDNMFNMVNQNQIKNYTETVCFKYKINSRPRV